MSNGQEHRGPWNEGKSPEFNETWQYIKDPLNHVRETNGLADRKPEGTNRTEKMVTEKNIELGKQRSSEVASASPPADISWSDYNI